jgi:hypothetical protein
MDKPGDEPRGQKLNEDQQRHLLVGFQYVDKLLSDIERILTASSARSPFPRYRWPLSPEQRAVVEERIALIRATIVRVLGEQGIPIQPGKVDTAFAIRSALRFADIAVEEMSPKYMRKYGDLDPSAVPELTSIGEELRAMVRALDVYVAGDTPRAG